ncbi:MAG: sulfite exporter TauE/SafE family protein [Bacillota bacterium]
MINIVLVVIVLGFLGAFIAGMAGIGGAIIMVPLLYFVPPILGFEQLSMQTVAGMTIVQVLIATGTAALVHRANNYINKELVKWMGTTIIIASFIGGLISKSVTESVMQQIFAVLALIAAIMMFIPKKEKNENIEVNFNKGLAVFFTFIVGLLAGIIGAGGAFLLVPIMLYILNIPLRITVGSSLAIVFFSSLAGFLGKVYTDQIVWNLAIAIVIGAIPGAYFGGKVSKHIPAKLLKVILAFLISGTALKMWISILINGG